MRRAQVRRSAAADSGHPGHDQCSPNEIMWHVYESCSPMTSREPDPAAADTHAVTDAAAPTITLRRGVNSTTQGDDGRRRGGVAQRWGQVASHRQVLWPGVETIEAKDAYTW